MNWQSGYLIVLFVTAAISLGIAVFAWLHRSRPGLLLFAGMMLAVSEYTLTAGLMSAAATPQGALFWVDPHYLGLTSMLAFYITFIIQFTGHGKWLNKFTLTLFFSIPVITQVIIETNPLHNWFIRSITFQQDGILMGLAAIEYGGFFWFHTIYSYALVLTGIGLIIAMSVRTFKLYRMQSLTLFVAVLAPLLGSINDSKVFMAGFPFPIVPVCFAFMGILIGWNMYRNQMLNIIPVARDTLIESMYDSLIVLDVAGQIIDINPAALQLLGKTAGQIIGKPADQIFSYWPDCLERFREKTEAESEIELDVGGGKRFFDIRISPLQTRLGRVTGRIIVLRNITNRVLAEKQLQESLENISSLQKQLYNQSIHDSLTGLYNRRYMDEILPREVANATRTQQPISFVMMDIDHFKTINDTYGHAFGDNVLQGLADLFREESRSGDLIFRFGGEEFLAVLTNTNAQCAFHFAERWQQSLQDFHLTCNGNSVGISMSMGIAEFERDGKTIAEVMLAADLALYKAKAAGRNCVTIFEKG